LEIGSGIQRSTGVIAQRDIKLSGYHNIVEALDAQDSEIDPETPIMVLSFRGELYELNTLGAIIWEYLELPRSLEEVLNEVSEQFEVNRSTVESDVVEYLDQLSQLGLVG